MSDRKPLKLAKCWSNPDFARGAVKRLRKRAAAGDRSAAENLRELFEARPDLQEQVEELEDLGGRCIKACIGALVGDDKLSEETIRKEVEALKKELTMDGSSKLDQVLITNVIVSHLANSFANLLAAKSSEKPGVTTLRLRRAESTQRRLTAALRSLALARDKLLNMRRPGRPRVSNN